MPDMLVGMNAVSSSRPPAIVSPTRARVLTCALIAVLAAGCASVPPEAVVSHQLIMSGIEVARRNQLGLIDDYAADQKDQKRLLAERVALPTLLTKITRENGTVQVADARTLTVDYSTDLQKEFDAIDSKARSLREQTNRGFDELLQLASLNHEFIEALKVRSDIVARLQGKYQGRLNGLQQEFSEILQEQKNPGENTDAISGVAPASAAAVAR